MLGLTYHGWTEIDSALAQALTILDSTICSGCGQSLLVSAEKDAIGALEVHEMWCEGCVVMERDSRGEEQPAGRKAFIVNSEGF